MHFFDILFKVKNHPNVLVTNRPSRTCYNLSLATFDCGILLPDYTVIWERGATRMWWRNKLGQMSNSYGPAYIEWIPTEQLIYKGYYMNGIKIESTQS